MNRELAHELNRVIGENNKLKDANQKLKSTLGGILEQAEAQFKAGDKVCTLGQANLRIIRDVLKEN